MRSRHLPQPLLLAILTTLAATTPAPAPAADAVPQPQITPPPSLVKRDPTQTYKNRRDILSDLDNDVHSVLSFLGSDVPSYVASGKSAIDHEFHWKQLYLEIEHRLTAPKRDTELLPGLSYWR